MKAHDHFRERWEQRGVSGYDVDKLFRLLIRYKDAGRDDIVWHCKRIPGGDFWAFRVEGRTFYALFKSGERTPATLYDHDLYRKKRAAVKKMRRPNPELKRYMDKRDLCE